VSTAFKLFDQASWGHHAMARPVIGARRNIERFSRDELLAYVGRQYSAGNVIVGVAGNVDTVAMARAAEVAFGDMPGGPVNTLEPPVYLGGVRTRRQSGSSQSHVVMGYPLAALTAEDATGGVAAALFGEGMSSPLLHEIRELRGLVYYAACSADVGPLAGQFVVEASTTPEHLDELFTELVRLLARQADHIDPQDLQRARNQLAVRRMRTLERPYRLLEAAAQDLFTLGRMRSQRELAERQDSVDARALQQHFARMLAQPASVAVAGKLSQGLRDRIHAALDSMPV
jgi:predicted Zn-dependent peptidase